MANQARMATQWTGLLGRPSTTQYHGIPLRVVGVGEEKEAAAPYGIDFELLSRGRGGAVVQPDKLWMNAKWNYYCPRNYSH